MLESNPSADMSAIHWAGTARSCPFCFCPVFWPGSEKLNSCLGSVCAKGSALLNGFAIEMLAIGAPGMVGGGRFWKRSKVLELFGIHDLGLGREFLVGGIGEGIIFVKDGDFSFRIFANGDGCFPQGIGGALGLDLVNELVILDGEVLRKYACLLVSEDKIQIVGGQ